MEEKEFKESLERYRNEFSEADIEQMLESRAWTDDERLASDLLTEKPEASETESADMRARLSKMTMPEKIKAAMFGNGIVRSILAYDANKMIQECVLRNPRLMLPEVEAFTKNPNISDHLIRLIGNSKEWTRYYSIKLNITCNPKTPADVALKWLRHLTNADIKKLSKSKNVPNLVASTAQKIIAAQEGT